MSNTENRPFDDAEAMAQALFAALKEASPRDGSGVLRADGPTLMMAIALLAGEVLATVPEERRDGVLGQFRATVTDQVARRAGKVTAIKGVALDFGGGGQAH